MDEKAEYLFIDVERVSNALDLPQTGIYVRASTPEGVWDSVDIALLQKPSLLRWLKSRGGHNIWAENVVALLLGHGHFDEENPESVELIEKEYESWLRVVHEFKDAIGEMNEPKYNRLISSMNLWAEHLSRLRYYNDEKSLKKSLQDKQNVYNTRVQESEMWKGKS